MWNTYSQTRSVNLSEGSDLAIASRSTGVYILHTKYASNVVYFCPTVFKCQNNGNHWPIIVLRELIFDPCFKDKNGKQLKKPYIFILILWVWNVKIKNHGLQVF